MINQKTNDALTESRLNKGLCDKDVAIERLRGQLQNCVNLLHRLKRHGYASDALVADDAIDSANKVLYETLGARKMNDNTEQNGSERAEVQSSLNDGLGLPFFMIDENLVCDEFNRICAYLVQHGQVVLISGYRKWYNPMRWIKGSRYSNRINPKYLHA